ncbi:MAG: hypothetical protein N2037_05185 [Acidimicrobiales bacterium]|nr:hypothetical protein [Acidimicrobiales bacterium]
MSDPQGSAPRWVQFALALCVLASASWSLFATQSIYPHLTSNNDEAVYLFQAHMLLHGELTLPADVHGGVFRPWMSGERGGKLVMVFPSTWPAVLAGAEAIFGRHEVGVALVAGALVAATYWLGRVALGGWRPALIAAGAMAGSPFFIIHAATRLSYLFAVLLEVLVLAAIIKAQRTGTVGWLVVAGLVGGVLFSARPFDAVLIGVCVVAFLVTSGASLWQALGWGLLGAALPVLGTLAYNFHLSDDPFRFPLFQSGGNNGFGFGRRWIVDGAPVIDVTPVMSLGAMRVNLGEFPHWIFGSLVALVPIAWGSWLLWRRDRPIAVLAVAITVVIPAGFLLYWGNTLVVNGRYDLGPHYYLSLLIPTTITTACALDELFAQKRVIAVAVVTILAVATLVFELPHKFGRAQEVTARAEADFLALRAVGIEPLPDGGARADRRAVIVLPASVDGGWVLHPRGYFANSVDLDTAVVYAADQGSKTLDLFGEVGGGREVWRLDAVVDPGDGITPRPTVTKLQRFEAARLNVRARIVNRDGSPVVTAFAKFGRNGLVCVLDHESEHGRPYDVEWVLDRDGVTLAGGCPGGGYLLGPEDSGLAIVGAGFGTSDDLGRVTHVDERFWARPTWSGIELAAPGVGHQVEPGASGTRVVVSDVRDRLTVTPSALR